MNWKLCRTATGVPEIVVREEADYCWGVSMLRELARQDRTLYRIAEGVYEAAKDHPGREF